jgi:hypothetical protein
VDRLVADLVHDLLAPEDGGLMPRFDLLARPQPAIGIFLAALGWALSHQWGSNAVINDCIAHGGGTVVLASITGLLITAAGGFYCFWAWRRGAADGRSFLAVLGMMLALIATFAIVLQIAAGLILPACAA